MTRTLPQRAGLYSTLLLVGMGAALAGWVAALLAFLFVWSVGIVGYEPAVAQFSLAAILSSLLLGLLFWWLFILRPRQFTLGRGIVIGSLGSLVAHPLFWFLSRVIVSLSGTQTVSVFGIAHPNLIDDVQESLFLSLYSLLFVGWITVLVGGVAGGLLVLGTRTFMVRQAGSQDL